MAKFEYLILDVLENDKGLFAIGGALNDKKVNSLQEVMNYCGSDGWEFVQHELHPELDNTNKFTGGRVHYFFFKKVAT